MNYSRLLNKDLVALLISILFSLILFFNSKSLAVTHVQSDISYLITTLTYPQTWYKDVFSIKEHNKYLQQKLIMSELKNSRLDSYKIENIKLREMLSFKDLNPWSLLPANVTNKNSSSIKSVIVDIGENDSIYKDSPVLDIHGLIGKVVSVGRGASKVQLINDKNFSISVRVGSDRSLANFIPTLGKYGVLQGVRKSMTLYPGEIAYTSGRSDIYPANIPVAKVISVNTENNSPFQDVVVEILANLNDLNYVFVIQ